MKNPKTKFIFGLVMMIFGVCELVVVLKNGFFDGLFLFLFIVVFGCSIPLAISGYHGMKDKTNPYISIPKVNTCIKTAEWPKDCKYHGTKNAGEIGIERNSKELAFYNACLAEGVKDFEGERNRQKAILVAKSRGYSQDIDTIQKAFKQGKADSVHNKNCGQARLTVSSKLSQLNIDEERLSDSLRFYGFKGKEKRLAMLSEIAKNISKEISEKKRTESSIDSVMYKKEKDWAVLGGLADGIAGPGAGVVTALNAQAENAAIREYNMNMMGAANTLHSMYRNDIASLRSALNNAENAQRAMETKLMSEDSKAEVFKHIRITNMKYEEDSIGALTISADFDIDPEYRIFETEEPTIDGCIAARIIKDEEMLGSAYFILPMDGIWRKTNLTAYSNATIDLNGKKAKSSYTISFEPDYLWAMERV